MSQQRFQERSDAVAACGVGAIGIEIQLPNMFYPSIHQHIAGAGIEAERGGIGRQYADVGNAADVEGNPCLAVVAKQGLVKSWYQWRTLTTGS